MATCRLCAVVPAALCVSNLASPPSVCFKPICFPQPQRNESNCCTQPGPRSILQPFSTYQRNDITRIYYDASQGLMCSNSRNTSVSASRVICYPFPMSFFTNLSIGLFTFNKGLALDQWIYQGIAISIQTNEEKHLQKREPMLCSQGNALVRPRPA